MQISDSFKYTHSNMLSPLKNLSWIEEQLPPEIDQKNMFGGVAYFLDERIVLILIESSKTREHKGKAYPFELWNGCLFPIEKIKQSTVFGRFTFLENHPARKNCLYLPADTEEFEEKVRLVLREINKRNPLFGSPVKVPPLRPIKKVEVTQKPIKKVKADKKRENQMILSVLKRKST